MSSFFDEIQIVGQVAAIEDEYTLVINRGENYGVSIGMIFAIFDDDSIEILDPATGQSLGPIPKEKLRVKVFDVYPKACRARTYRTNGPLDRVLKSAFASPDQSSIFGGRDKIRSSDIPDPNEPGKQLVVTVNVGDSARLVDKERRL